MLTLDYSETKENVCRELGFNPNHPLITYAPAGKKKFMKPGGSLSKKTLSYLNKFSKENPHVNILVKVKYDRVKSPMYFINSSVKNLLDFYRRITIGDSSNDWTNIVRKIESQKE